MLVARGTASRLKASITAPRSRTPISTIRVKRLGQPVVELDYPRQRQNFAGDCVFFLQRHFVDCMLSGQEFESSGADYLKNVHIVEAAYESSRTGNSVRVG